MKKTAKAIALLAFLLMFTFVSASCGNESSKDGPAPTDVAKSFLEAVKTQDEEKLEALYVGEELELFNTDQVGLEDETEALLMEKFLDFDYTVANEQINGTNATVDVTITTYDMGQAFSSLIEDFLSQALSMAFSGKTEDEIEAQSLAMIKDAFGALKEKNHTQTVSLPLEMSDGIWKVSVIRYDSEITNALSGGMVDAASEFGDALGDALGEAFSD